MMPYNVYHVYHAAQSVCQPISSVVTDQTV